jgi:hypothetical protein
VYIRDTKTHISSNSAILAFDQISSKNLIHYSSLTTSSDQGYTSEIVKFSITSMKYIGFLSNSIRHHIKEIHQISSNLAIATFNQISSNSDICPEPSLSLIFQISSNSAIVAFDQISSKSDLHPGAFITSDYARGLQNRLWTREL